MSLYILGKYVPHFLPRYIRSSSFLCTFIIVPTFQIYGQNYANQILAFTVHQTVCSSAMCCYLTLQYEARDLFYAIFFYLSVLEYRYT